MVLVHCRHGIKFCGGSCGEAVCSVFVFLGGELSVAVLSVSQRFDRPSDVEALCNCALVVSGKVALVSTVNIFTVDVSDAEPSSSSSKQRQL